MDDHQTKSCTEFDDFQGISCTGQAKTVNEYFHKNSILFAK